MPPGPLRVRRGPAPAPPRIVRPSIHPVAPPNERLDALLADLGPSLRRGDAEILSQDRVRDRVRACGLPAIDQLIGGGFPTDRLSEITGPASSGRTSVALSLLARTTRQQGELAAVVDLADAFDPVSAEASGVDLDRVLWVRAGGLREALRSVERLLETEGIPVVLLDSCSPGLEAKPPTSAWIRLSRLANATGTTLLMLSEQRLAGSQAELVLAMRPPRPRFTGTPPLLEEIGLHGVLVRRRGGPVQDTSNDVPGSDAAPDTALRIESG